MPWLDRGERAARTDVRGYGAGILGGGIAADVSRRQCPGWACVELLNVQRETSNTQR